MSGSSLSERAVVRPRLRWDDVQCGSVAVWQCGVRYAGKLRAQAARRQGHAPPGSQAKKDPAVARRVGKFWERMPERQDLYALHRGFVQMRNDQDWLYFLQPKPQTYDFVQISNCFIRNKTHPFCCQLFASSGCESGWCAAQADSVHSQRAHPWCTSLPIRRITDSG